MQRTSFQFWNADRYTNMSINHVAKKRLAVETAQRASGAEVAALKRLQAETAAGSDALLSAILDRAFKAKL